MRYTVLVLVTVHEMLGKIASQITCNFWQANLGGTSQGLARVATYCM